MKKYGYWPSERGILEGTRVYGTLFSASICYSASLRITYFLIVPVSSNSTHDWLGKLIVAYGQLRTWQSGSFKIALHSKRLFVSTFIYWAKKSDRQAQTLNTLMRGMHIGIGELSLHLIDFGLCGSELLSPSIGPFKSSSSKIWIKVRRISFQEMHWKIASENWRPFCLGFNVLRSLIMAELKHNYAVSVCMWFNGD